MWCLDGVYTLAMLQLLDVDLIVKITLKKLLVSEVFIFLTLKLCAAWMVHTGCSILLATPTFPYVPDMGEKWCGKKQSSRIS